MEFFSNYFCTSFFNVCNLLSCYHNGRILICRYQGVMLGKKVKLFFVNFAIIIRARLRLLAKSSVNSYSSNFKKNKYLWVGCYSILLIWKLEPPYIQIAYENFISGNLFIYKLVHTSRGNRYLKYGRNSQRTGVKVEKKRFHFRKENGGTKSK